MFRNIVFYLMGFFMLLNHVSILAFSQDTITEVPFKIDEELEKIPNAKADNCFREFLCKGGKLEVVLSLSEEREKKIVLSKGNAIYPICSGGWCRSQTLWALLHPYAESIVLFPPHAARVGWDPYNGQINRFKSYDKEILPDEFHLFFEKEKSLRFGFDNVLEWENVERNPTTEGLTGITQYFDRHYFGPDSTWQGKQGKERIYIAFAQNVHVVLYRLIHNNDNLEGVTVIAINSEDIISDPPRDLNTPSRSQKAYEHFFSLLSRVFDFSELTALSRE